MKSLVLSLITASVLVGCGGGSGSSSSGSTAPTVNGNEFKSSCNHLPAGDEPLVFTVKGDTAELSGAICDGSPRAFDRMMSDHANIKLLKFVDIPGSLDDEANLKLAYKVRSKNLNSFIDSDGVIASGGTDLFLAGVERTVVSGAQIGVHSWSNGQISGASLPRDPNHASHKPYIDYYQAMGLSDPAGFYFFTLDAAPAEDIYNLTPAEIKKYQFNNVATAKVTDPRATYSATYTELQSVLFDVKSDTKHGLNAENNVRTIAYIIDESVSSVFKAFNVSTIKELEALLKTHGNSFVKANYKATIEADGALKVVTVNKANIGFSGPRIIEHEKGIAEFKKPAKETEMIILLKDHVVDVDLFGEKFSHSKSDSNQEFVLCAIPETSDQGENEVHTRFCSKTAISAANVNTANEVTISTKNKKTGKVEVQVMKLENYNFELNRKQSTLVQQ